MGIAHLAAEVGLDPPPGPGTAMVLDPFGGSGTTLIAAERTGRSARLLELDPKYVDVIVERWQNLTGGVAVLEGEDRTYDDLKAIRTRQLAQSTLREG